MARIVKEAVVRLDNVTTVGILADPGCRAGWERNFPPLLEKAARDHAPQAYLVAGDLTLNSTEDEYRRIIFHIEKTDAAWITVPGDHDRPLAPFRRYFGATRRVADIGKWRFIGVNTANRMFLRTEEEWIDRHIRPHSIIVSHMPPMADGWTFHSLWPRSSARLLDTVSRHRRKIEAMYFGHIHGHSVREFRGIPMTATGGVAESWTVRNNRYDGPGPIQMIIFDVKSGKTSLCALS